MACGTPANKYNQNSRYLVELQCFPADYQCFVVVFDVLRRPWQVRTTGLEMRNAVVNILCESMSLEKDL